MGCGASSKKQSQVAPQPDSQQKQEEQQPLKQNQDEEDLTKKQTQAEEKKQTQVEEEKRTEDGKESLPLLAVAPADGTAAAATPASGDGKPVEDQTEDDKSAAKSKDREAKKQKRREKAMERLTKMEAQMSQDIKEGDADDEGEPGMKEKGDKAKLILSLLKKDFLSGELEKALAPPTSDEDAEKIKAKWEEERLAKVASVRQQLDEGTGLAKEELACGQEPLQKRVPPSQWALTHAQWNGYVDMCKETAEYKQLVEKKGTVNMYELNKMCVVPHTAGLGASVALLMNYSKPLPASIMISHAWGEDVEQCQKAMQNICVPDDITIWFCVFANYQCGGLPGDVGPDIGWQLSLNPFQQVISDKDLVAMVVVHTTAEEVYSRLWCVHEIDVAITSEKRVWPACSMEYSSERASSEPLAGTTEDQVAVDCSSARCGRKEDEEMLRRIVEENGGFERLNDAIVNFRMSMVQYNSMVGFFAFLAGPMLITTSLNYIWKNPQQLSPSDLELFIGILPGVMEAAFGGGDDQSEEEADDSAYGD